IVRSKMEKYGEFIIETNDDNTVKTIRNKQDKFKMNWVRTEGNWGKVIKPDKVEVTVSRSIKSNGNLVENYIFKNNTKFPVYFQKTDLGIYTTFNDSYEDSKNCLNQNCHAHVSCAGDYSYIMGLRMSGVGPHLGLQQTEGAVSSYSIERDFTNSSSDRGSIILHPEIKYLLPGEEKQISWELFWFNSRDQFKAKLLENNQFIYVELEKAIFFENENFQLNILANKQINVKDLSITCKGKKVQFHVEELKEKLLIRVEHPQDTLGEYEFEVKYKEKQTKAVLYKTSNLQNLVKERCEFIQNFQQNDDVNSPLYGSYLIFDNDTKEQYYTHLNDHNGGRERVAMGALIAKWLQNNNDSRLMDSLDKYVEFIYRELYDEESGEVFNDILRDNSEKRLYNYSWIAILQINLFELLGEIKYLKDAYKTIIKYYDEGGHYFYAIGIPMVELYEHLLDNNLIEEASDLKVEFIKHAEVLISNGSNYPESEVPYEQSIVAPAVDYLLQVYQITKIDKYLDEALIHFETLSLFHGRQANYFQYVNAIRHWDGYWFGKNKLYGDTFPHYWSMLTAINHGRLVSIYAQDDKTNKSKAKENKLLANAMFRGCLSLFNLDGSASCAMVYPQTINGIKANSFDPWANDQDWALYYALSYEEIL
ncbi:MAG: hypothetical protein ACK5NF_02740, partial [Bacilli bacterium]